MTPINKLDNCFSKYSQEWKRFVFKWCFWEVWTHNGKHTHIITYEQTILKISPTQVRYKTLCFFTEHTHVNSKECNMILLHVGSCGWQAGVVNEDQWIWHTVVQEQLQMKLGDNDSSMLRTVTVSCKDISWATFKDIANLSDIMKNRNQI